MAIAEQASLGNIGETPLATTGEQSMPWESAEQAGIPRRLAPPLPWQPRVPPSTPAIPKPGRVPAEPQKV